MLYVDLTRHELLNPAGAALSMAEMVCSEEEDSHKKKGLQILLKNVKRIIELIDNASILAHMESGEDVEFFEDDLGLILKTAINDSLPLSNEKGMEIRLASPGRFPVRVSPMIYHVFSNLLSNAIKYSPKGSLVLVKIEKNGIEWKVSISDCGEGIPDREKELVFNRFQRFQKGAARGNGLGLAIVKRVVELHKGRVWVEDNNDGGSTFNVTLSRI